MTKVRNRVRHAHSRAMILCIFISILFVLCASDSLNKDDKKGSALTLVESTDEAEDGMVRVEEEATPTADDNSDYFGEEFKATNEWQDVKEGQKIPPGLHVQMDFKTGKKQAKIMEKSAKPTIKRWDAGKNFGFINTEKPRYTREQLKAALKDFKYQDIKPEEEERQKKIKENFRSYEELKKALKDIKLSVKTEGDIVRELTNKLNESSKDRDQLKTILVDLEYYLHQIDNAQLFCDLGGMNSVLNLMNNTAEEIRENACHTLGAAMQSNAKVQVTAMESGVLHHLIRGLATESSKIVQKRMLFALSTLLRQFPFAQQKFLKEGGLTALASLFKQADNRNIQIKIVTLLTDLLTESDAYMGSSSSGSQVEIERKRQYQAINLREAMTSTGWCRLMPTLLQGTQEHAEHDSVEKVIQAMSTLAEACSTQFSSTRPTLQALLKRYSELAKEEQAEAESGSDDFFSSIHSSLQQLVNQIHRDDL
ncbi:nucleotide exchange factor SIL1 [Elysia marginata]|uniref:Nucleotide exchange factor SIL1 n=1 Tax=Elysia marginata TaxID=1093978 RepID=A0AAV4EKR2_9GAST|nr:nucleotide exchange factor SIL1 [Elysia marginata]